VKPDRGIPQEYLAVKGKKEKEKSSRESSESWSDGERLGDVMHGMERDLCCSRNARLLGNAASRRREGGRVRTGNRPRSTRAREAAPFHPATNQWKGRKMTDSNPWCLS
jgi:hypothetical protein